MRVTIHIPRWQQISSGRGPRRTSAVALAGFAVMAILTGCTVPKGTAAPIHLTPSSASITTDILANKAGGPQDNWPAYQPSSFVVPAHSVVTVTIRNFDLGDSDLPKNSPFTAVQGTIGNVAYIDGKPFSALAADKVAHTFTISALHLNVPIPGDAAMGKQDVTVTFSFRTGGTGMLMWQCYDPCGTDPNGWGGPMATMGYMHDMITVVG